MPENIVQKNRFERFVSLMHAKWRIWSKWLDWTTVIVFMFFMLILCMFASCQLNSKVDAEIVSRSRSVIEVRDEIAKNRNEMLDLNFKVEKMSRERDIVNEKASKVLLEIEGMRKQFAYTNRQIALNNAEIMDSINNRYDSLALDIQKVGERQAVDRMQVESLKQFLIVRNRSALPPPIDFDYVVEEEKPKKKVSWYNPFTWLR